MLEVPDIFAHADEQVYGRVLHLVWKHKDEYANIIPLMGGFHQLRVFQDTTARAIEIGLLMQES